jgi:hypothetical protein
LVVADSDDSDVGPAPDEVPEASVLLDDEPIVLVGTVEGSEPAVEESPETVEDSPPQPNATMTGMKRCLMYAGPILGRFHP